MTAEIEQSGAARSVSRTGLLIAGACLALGAAGYAAKGSPLMPGQPMSERLAELERKPPGDMTAAEQLTRLQAIARAQPEAAEPHYFIGQMMLSAGREDDAMRAWRSAVRRDDAHAPSLVALADVLVRRGEGRVSDPAARLYTRAFEVDPARVRAGFMAGLATWQDGDRAGAERWWDEVAARIPPGAPQAPMLPALREAARSGLDAPSKDAGER